MKKQVCLFVLLIFAVSSIAQQTTTETPGVKTDYLKKSKNQKTAAWILLGGGAGLASAGFAVGMNEAVDAIGNIFFP